MQSIEKVSKNSVMKRRLFISVFLVGILALTLGFIMFIEPSVKLSGIENGKVYAVHPVIQLKESIGTARVTLNGKKIGPKYKVKENGSYVLKLESTLLWKKKKLSYTFVVDDKPPITPRIKEVVEKVYFKQAKFTLNREEHVKYKARLNGKEVPLDQPIQQPGKNTLIITATKPNGLTSTKEISFLIDERTFPEKTIHQFADYYFNNEIPIIYKFTGDVAITLSGDYNEEDKKMIEKAINEIKTFFPYEMKIIDSSFNKDYDRYIKMVFTSTTDFKSYDVHRNDVWGVEMPTMISRAYGTMESLVLVGTDKEITRDYRNAVILHELLHAVGLHNHIKSANSALYQEVNKIVTLGDEEKKYGELLYLGEVKPTITKEAVLKQLKQRIQ
ncbi:hypothetical protein ABES03_10890 [Neobacillus rhizosphaerae]|uniref:hypothetical protein n=1 Tax=Neobacillus rhizosphaerae TaxID=2880965 RepID=UPI003D2CC58E